jgi:hypothetical protein
MFRDLFARQYVSGHRVRQKEVRAGHTAAMSKDGCRSVGQRPGDNHNPAGRVYCPADTPNAECRFTGCFRLVILQNRADIQAGAPDALGFRKPAPRRNMPDGSDCSSAMSMICCRISSPMRFHTRLGADGRSSSASGRHAFLQVARLSAQVLRLVHGREAVTIRRVLPASREEADAKK